MATKQSLVYDNFFVFGNRGGRKQAGLFYQEIFFMETIRGIEKDSIYILLIFSCLVVILYPSWAIILSLLSGGLIMSGNLRLLRGVVGEVIFDPEPKKYQLIGKILLKLFGLLSIVGAILLFSGVNSLAFLLGTTNIFFAVILSGIKGMKPAQELRRLNGRASL